MNLVFDRPGPLQLLTCSYPVCHEDWTVMSEKQSAWQGSAADERSSVLSVQVGEAVCLESLSYHEAWELSYFGASVLHPRTTMPAMKYSIPITIRNFFNRSATGVP